MANIFKNLWYMLETQDEKRLKRNDDLSLEHFNKMALEYINAVPCENGYHVVFDGYVISERMSAEDALHLVDVIRRNYIDKNMSKSMDIWYRQ